MELTPELIADLRKIIDYTREGPTGNDTFPALLRLKTALPEDADL